eukprot:symbB.v1.2.019424.t1/scaffold1560.1/size111759/15
MMSSEASRSASPVAVRQRLLHASRNNPTAFITGKTELASEASYPPSNWCHLTGCSFEVWYFEVHLGGSSLESASQQLPPGRPHLRAARHLLCRQLNAAGAAVAWPRPGLLCVHLLVPQEPEQPGSTWSHWLVKSHLNGELADAAKALLREAPKGFDTLEVEHLSAPVPDVWVDATEEVMDLGLELTGASLQEASISKSMMGGFIWNHGLQTSNLTENCWKERV